MPRLLQVLPLLMMVALVSLQPHWSLQSIKIPMLVQSASILAATSAVMAPVRPSFQTRTRLPQTGRVASEVPLDRAKFRVEGRTFRTSSKFRGKTMCPRPTTTSLAVSSQTRISSACSTAPRTLAQTTATQTRVQGHRRRALNDPRSATDFNSSRIQTSIRPPTILVMTRTLTRRTAFSSRHNTTHQRWPLLPTPQACSQ